MKLKPCKDKSTLPQIIKDTYSVSQQVSATSITIDVNGCIVLENFKKLIDYSSKMIALETNDKTVYIYGENIVLASCNRYNAVVCGEIFKVEIFSKGECTDAGKDKV